MKNKKFSNYLISKFFEHSKVQKFWHSDKTKLGNYLEPLLTSIAKGKFYFKQFFFTLLWTFRKKKLGEKRRRLVYSFRRKRGGSWTVERRCCGVRMSEAAGRESGKRGPWQRTGWGRILGMVNAKMLKWVFTIPCFMLWKKSEMYRGKKYNFNGGEGGVQGGRERADEFSLYFRGWNERSLKNKDKNASLVGCSVKRKIMKMAAACNFLIASHFTSRKKEKKHFTVTETRKALWTR